MSPAGSRSHPAPRWRKALLALVAAAVGLCLLEGACSLGVFLSDAAFRTERPLAERQHTQYDPELGWVNEPSRTVEDLYGPGRTLSINSQGFRATRDYSADVPAGRTRILCSGDSFTLGYGVADDQTWPAALERRSPKLEVVNMGQGGYGIDQCYLWHERDGRRLRHQLHVHGIIYRDFARMTLESFAGYGKPVLELEAGQLVARNVPVPRRGFHVPWLTQNQGIFRRLGVVRAGELLFGSAGSAGGADAPDLAAAMRLSVVAFGRMHEGDLAHGSRLVVAWLPIRHEYRPYESDAMREALLATLRRGGVLVIDLVPGFRALPHEQVQGMFLTADEVDYPSAAGHYTAAGNDYVAGRIAEELGRMPELASLWR